MADKAPRHNVFGKIYIDRDRLLEVIVNNIGDGLIAVDTEGRIYLMNPVAEHITGWKTNQVLGKKINDIYQTVEYGENNTPGSPPVLKLFEERKSFSVHSRFILMRKDKSKVHIRETASPIIDEHDNLLGVIFLFSEVDPAADQA